MAQNVCAILAVQIIAARTPLLQSAHFAASPPQDGGEDDGEVEELAAALPLEAGMRKSARTEHIDFKQREEERWAGTGGWRGGLSVVAASQPACSCAGGQNCVHGTMPYASVAWPLCPCLRCSYGVEAPLPAAQRRWHANMRRRR